MAIAFEAALAPGANFTAGGPTGTQTTGALNASANANRLVVLMVTAYSSGGSDNAINAARYGGVTMTADTERDVSGDFGGFSRARYFYLVAAPSGSNTFDIDFTNGTSVRLEWAAVAYSGVASVSAVQFPTNTGAYNTGLTIDITSATGETALAVFTYPADQRATPGTGVTERVDGSADASAGSMYFAEKAGASTVTVDATTSGNAAGWRAWGLSMVASGGGGGSSISAISNYYRMMGSA